MIFHIVGLVTTAVCQVVRNGGRQRDAEKGQGRQTERERDRETETESHDTIVSPTQNSGVTLLHFVGLVVTTPINTKYSLYDFAL